MSRRLSALALGLALLTCSACARPRGPYPSIRIPPAVEDSTRTSTSPASAAPPAVPGSTPFVLTIEGLETPAAAFHDTRSDVYLVSCVGGEPYAEDGNGAIARISPDGKSQDARWIRGGQNGVVLHAPRGMVALENRLFVADLRWVRSFDLDTGKPLDSVEVPGASTLVDVAIVPGGGLIAIDSGLSAQGPTGHDAIYRLSPDRQVSVLIHDPILAHPGGVLGGTDFVDVVTLGGAGLFRVGLDGTVRGMRTAPRGELVGLALLPDGRRAFASRQGGGIFVIDAAFNIQALVLGLDNPGDLGVDLNRRRILVPLGGTPGRLLIRGL